MDIAAAKTGCGKGLVNRLGGAFVEGGVGSGGLAVSDNLGEDRKARCFSRSPVGNDYGSCPIGDL
jgi:hypothetical protein